MPENPKFQFVLRVKILTSCSPHQLAHFHQADWCLDTDPDLLEFVISVAASFDIPSPSKAFLKPSMPPTVVVAFLQKVILLGRILGC